MIQTLRNKASSWLVKILLLLLVLSFAVWGIGDFFRDAPPDTIVATVGEVEIDLNTFNAEFQRQVEFEREADPFYTTDDALADGLYDDVLQRLINQALLSQVGTDLNFVIPDEVIIANIQSDPNFRDPSTGQFDGQRLLFALSRAGLSEEAYVQNQRSALQQTVIRQSVLRSAWTPAILGDALYGFAQERRTADTVTIPYSVIQDISDPTDADLRNFYEENGDLFMAPEYRNLTVVTVSPEDFTSEIVVSDEEVADEYAFRRDQYHTPETYLLDRVIIEDEEAAAEFAAAAQAAGNLEDALANSEGLNAQIRPYTVTAEDARTNELADGALALAVGEISDPLPSLLGWYVLRLHTIEEETTQPLEEVAESLREDIQYDQALDIVFERADSLSDELAADIRPAEAAQVLGLTAINTPPIAEDGSVASGSDLFFMPNLTAIVETAFHLDEGENTLLEEIEGTFFYFTVRVDGIIPPAVRLFDEVRGEVEAAWRLRAQGDRAAQLAELASQRLAAGNDPAAVANEFDGSSATMTGLLRDASNNSALNESAIETVFAMEVGDVEVVDDGANQLVLRLAEIDVPTPDPEDPEYNAIQSRTENAIATDILLQFLRQLENTIEVEIHQSVLDRQYRQS